MHKIDIRKAVPAEKAVLEALQMRASLGNSGDREFILANPGVIEVPAQQLQDGAVFVAEADGAIVGFAAVIARGDGSMELDALFTEPASWRKGIGKALVMYCFAQAKAAGASVMHVIGNPHAEGFYAACGFTLVRTIPMESGCGLEMARDLKELN